MLAKKGFYNSGLGRVDSKIITSANVNDPFWLNEMDSSRFEILAQRFAMLRHHSSQDDTIGRLNGNNIRLSEVPQLNRCVR